MKEFPKGFFFVSITPDRYRSFRWFLSAMVAVSIASTCIEGGLHSLFLLLLPLIVLALLRGDYGSTFLMSERTAFILFGIYLVFLVCFAVVFRGRLSLPSLIVHFSFGILLVRVLNVLTDRNVEQVFLLSLGLILINCIITNHILFGLLLPLYLFLFMTSLLLFHAARRGRLAQDDRVTGRQESDNIPVERLAKYTIAVVAGTLLFFVLLPRPFFSMPGFRMAMSGSGELGGMAQRISYREMMGMSDRQRIAFQVKLEGGSLAREPYWRGRALEKFDGKNWTAAEGRKAAGRPVPLDYSIATVYQFIPYKLQTNTIYASGLPISAFGRMRHPLHIDPAGEILVDSPFLFSDSYEVTVLNRPFPMGRRSEVVNLDRTGITPKIAEFARQLTAGVSLPSEKAKRLVSGLRDHFRYEFEPSPPPPDVHPIEHFLFQSRSGHCEYFAGALCLLLRAEGIPARVVEGFSGMERSSESEEYTVRFAHAHAWVEAGLGDDQWTLLEPTPASRLETESYLRQFATDLYDTIEKKWTKYVVYFDRGDQARIYSVIQELFDSDIVFEEIRSAVRPYLVVALCGVIGALSIFLGAYTVRRNRRPPSSVYLSAMQDLVRAGVLDKVHQWHELNAMEVSENAPHVSETVAEFMRTYFDERFGKKSFSIGRLEHARKKMASELTRKSAKSVRTNAS
jgi:transglutaminase-like putative cysteine protease